LSKNTAFSELLYMLMESDQLLWYDIMF